MLTILKICARFLKFMVRKSKSMYFTKSTKGNRNLDIYKCP
jgi:hypothetical protein